MVPYYIDLAHAMAVLLPRLPVFAGSLRKAIFEWNNGLGAYHAVIDEFARGVVINRMWYAFSSQSLQGDDGISLEKHGNGSYYTVDSKVVLRFKHVDNAYRSWNHPTPRSRAWASQASFPTMPPLAKLELGYRLDLTGTIVKDAMVMLNYKGRPVWRWQVWGHRISEFAAAPVDMMGRLIFSHDDFSGVVLP